MDYERFSVLIPVYQKENPAWLSESLASVLYQTVTPSEIVIVEDGPLTGSLDKVINDFMGLNPGLFKVIQTERHYGLGFALSKGVLNCSYDLIARMDADDICVNTRFETQLAFLKENPDIDIVGSNICEFQSHCASPLYQHVVPESNPDICNFSKRRNPFCHMTVMFKKKSVVESGNYLSFPYFEDYFLWVRMLKRGCKGYNIQKTLVLARVDGFTYKRRGGLLYFKNETCFFVALLRKHYIGLITFESVILERFVARILPNTIREYGYKRMMRKSVESSLPW